MKLQTNLAKGLSTSDSAKKRMEYYGSNSKPATVVTPFYKIFLGALDDFMLKLLLVCAVVDLSVEVSFAKPDERDTGMHSF